MIGSFIGILLMLSTVESDDGNLIAFMFVIGFLVVPFILSVIGEFISSKDVSIAFKAGVAAWVNYLINTLLQLAVSVYCIYGAFTSFGN